MTTWERIIAADPRVGRLVDAASGLSGSTTAYQHTPDHLYVDAKPFLGALVGWRRGGNPTPRNEPPLAHDRLFAEIVTEPSRVGTDEEFLNSAYAFDEACAQLYNQVCQAYDRKRAA